MATANIPLSSGDGELQSYAVAGPGAAGNWSAAQAGTGDPIGVIQNADIRSLLQAGAPYAYDNTIERVALPFDFGTLVPAGSTITAATLKLYINAKDTSGGDSSVYITSSTQASLTALVAADWSRLGGSTVYNDPNSTFSGVTTGQYLDLALNATAVALMSPGGTFKCAFRCAGDVLATGYPATPAFGGGYNTVMLTANGSRAASNKSYLEVTYTAPPSPIPAVMRANPAATRASRW